MKKALLILCILAGFTTQAQLVFTNTSPGRFDITFTPDATVIDQDGRSIFIPTDNFGSLFLHMTIVPVNLTPNGTANYTDEQIMVNTTGLVTLTGNGFGSWTGKLNLNSHQFTSTTNTLPVGTTVNPDFLIQLGTTGGTQLTQDLQAGAYGFTATTTVTQTYVTIPDTIFEQVLVMQGKDTDGLNGKILTTDATAVTSLDVSFFAATSNMPSLISDLTGIEGFTNLTALNCSGNKIRTLDLHLNTKLIALHAEGNGMTTLNVQNGNNAIMHTASMTNSQLGYWLTGNNLFCVTVDPFAAFSSIPLPPPAPSIPNTPPTSFHIDGSVRGFSPTSCNDLEITPFLASFPPEIIAILNAQADANSDGHLLLGEVIAFVGSLDFSTIPGGVNDLSFLDAFTSISGLNLANSVFSSIDLTNYPDLTSLDLTGNTNLASLDASTLASLQTLVADGNAALTQLLLTGSMTGLTTVNCPLLGTIDLSNLDQLTTLLATGNALLTTLTMPTGTSTAGKSGTANKISVVNTTLTSIDVQNNGLTGTLDLTNFSALTSIKVNDNSLTGLNVRNGNNANVPTANFNATGNTGLTSITVDDVAYSNTNWTSIDAGVTFTTGVLGIEDNILASKINIYPNPTKGLLNIAIPSEYSVISISIFDVTGKQVKQAKTASKPIDIRNLSNGFYILKVNTNKGQVSKKILKY